MRGMERSTHDLSAAPLWLLLDNHHNLLLVQNLISQRYKDVLSHSRRNSNPSSILSWSRNCHRERYAGEVRARSSRGRRLGLQICYSSMSIAIFIQELPFKVSKFSHRNYLSCHYSFISSKVEKYLTRLASGSTNWPISTHLFSSCCLAAWQKRGVRCDTNFWIEMLSFRPTPLLYYRTSLSIKDMMRTPRKDIVKIKGLQGASNAARHSEICVNM